MKIVDPHFIILEPVNEFEAKKMLRVVELAARTCYKSEEKITKDSCLDFVKMLVKRGHTAMLEFCVMTVKFVCDRGVSHELVRHRLASYAQESTRYCDYLSNGIQVICPEEIMNDEFAFFTWKTMVENAESAYEALRKECKLSPQIARSVLPTCLKTEIVIQANLTEWRHIFKLRTAPQAHPQMRELMVPLLQDARDLFPGVFEDIWEKTR